MCVHAALDNSKKMLVVTMNRRVFLEPIHRFGGPTERVVQAVFRFFDRARIRRAFVQSHDDIRADFALGVHYACRAKEMLGAVENASEFHSFRLDFAKIFQTPHLKSAAVREHRAVPTHELVDASRRSDFRRCRAQVQMVRVRENDFGLDVLELCWSHRLDGCFGAHRHENWRMDIAVIRVDYSEACLGLLGCF